MTWALRPKPGSAPPSQRNASRSDGGVAGERDDLREEADEEPGRVCSRDRVPYLCEPGSPGDQQPDPDDEARGDDDPERRPPPRGNEVPWGSIVTHLAHLPCNALSRGPPRRSAERRPGDRVRRVVVARPDDDEGHERRVGVRGSLDDGDPARSAIADPVSTANATWRLASAATGL